MNHEALARLRRLGVVKGVRNLKTTQTRNAPGSKATNQEPSKPASPLQYGDDEENRRPLKELLPGLQLMDNEAGACYVLDKVYPLSHTHGSCRLCDLLEFSPQVAAHFCQDERLNGAEFQHFLFLDTETTGLGGAGTLAFMVGVAFFDGDAFVVRQYFLRDHGDEPAMLWSLNNLLQDKAGLITFNGRSFDLPLLEGRFVMNRMPPGLSEQPHIDLLPPARRLWGRRLDSCALSSLEQNLLGLKRTHEDVPGWLIPSLYHHYLQTGDGRELTRVFYHNRIDMLSMVSLATRIVRQFHQPDVADHPLDLFGLGKWQADLGLVEQAEQVLRMAAVPELPTEYYHQALTQLAYLLKRAERRDEAVEVWQQIACTTFDDVTAHVELAKHYEWHEADLERARLWTEQALELIEGMRVPSTRAELEHRLARLNRKLEKASGGA
jgi:uncharacterized protein YprB with RNaseH-like and TPR domain